MSSIAQKIIELIEENTNWSVEFDLRFDNKRGVIICITLQGTDLEVLVLGATGKIAPAIRVEPKTFVLNDPNSLPDLIRHLDWIDSLSV